MRVLLKGPYTPYSGYGSDLIAMTRAFINWGAEVYIQPTLIEGPIPTEVLMLLTKHLKAPFDLAIVHTDPASIDASKAMKNAAGLVVGWTMWENTKISFPEEKKPLKERLENFDVLLAYDDVSKTALSEHSGTIPIAVVQGGYEPADWPYMERDWSGVFRFCMQGALHTRKSPMTAIEAFKELKDEYPEFASVELHLKDVGAGGLHPKMMDWCSGLFIYNEIWPLKTLQEFYSRMHVILCPSQGEGKNLPALQMLSTGGTVIATNWGGHQQWLSEQYAYPLNYALYKDASGATSARPDKDHLKSLMLRVFRDREETYRKAEIGARVIPLMCNWDSVLLRMFENLSDVPGGREVRDAAVRCRIEQDTEHLETRQKSMTFRGL
jgi:glycosyltransferase involved in cell wall biosynthesis